MQFIENAEGQEKDDDDSESESDAVSVSSKHKKRDTLNNKKSMDRLQRSPTNKMGAGAGGTENQMQDLKKILNQQQVVNAQNKEFLKSEIHRMV